MEKNKQPSSTLYLVLGATTFLASALVFFILFFSGMFRVTFSNTYALLPIGFIYGVSLFSIFALLYKWREAPERARVLQSHQMLTIANETAPYLRHGFSIETVEKVASIILDSTDADAITITDNNSIMAFAGAGAEYHRPGDTLLKPVSTKKITSNSDLSVFTVKEEAGCPDKSDLSWNGVSIPLTIQNRSIGTLDFLYLSPRRLTESHITVAKGLGKLLCTQLELSELDKQRRLAFQAELKALRAQINPHFLFNTLNTIAVLCRTDPQTARRLLLKFADFFRDSLERQSQFSSLEEELKYVDSYLTFEQARFGAKLMVQRNIESATRGVQVPSLVLQPLVENAIKHGMAKRGQLNLALSAKINSKNLIISVKDDGVGIKSDKLPKSHSPNRGLGIGLNNVRERLATLYGSTNLMAISSAEGQGTEVTLKIPIAGGISEN